MHIRVAGTGEKSLYLAKEYNDITIRFLLHYPGIVNADILCAASRSVIDSVDILHSSFITNSYTAYWRINERYEDSTFFTFTRTGDDILTVARKLALISIPPESITQFRCNLVQNDTDSIVVVTVSHLCVDGGDAKYLLCKLAEAYRMHEEAGTAKDLFVKNGSRAAEQIYKGRSIQNILTLMRMPESSEKTIFPFLSEAFGSARISTILITSHIMEAARQKAKLQGATVNDLLLAAFCHAYALLPSVDQNAPIRITSMMDLRKHCKTGSSSGLGNLSGTFSTVISNCQTLDLQNALELVAVQTKAVKANPLLAMTGLPLLHLACKVLPMKKLMDLSQNVYGNMSLGLTNLGSISCKELKLGDIRPDYGIVGGSLKKKPGMQISALSFDGNCCLSIAGYYTDEDEKSLQALLNCMTSEIIKYAS